MEGNFCEIGNGEAFSFQSSSEGNTEKYNGFVVFKLNIHGSTGK